MRDKKFLIRKLEVKILILAVTTLMAAFPVKAQDAKIELPLRTLSSEEVFDAIQRQTNYLVAVNNTRTDGLSVRVSKSPISVSEVLGNLLYGKGKSYRVDGNYILIFERAAEPRNTSVSDRRPVVAMAPVGVPANQFSSVAESPRPQAAYQPTTYDRPNVYNATNQYQFGTRQEESVFSEKYLPGLALKTNLLYAFGTMTPNLGLEIGLNKRSTLNISAGYNPWNLDGDYGDNKKLVHWLGNVEYRWWLCERFNGHFFGAHVLGGQYNIGEYDVPMLFEKESRYEGWGAGVGLSYGYQWIWSKRWAMEFNLGLGYIHLEYDIYGCEKCAEMEGQEKKNYFGPTKAGINLVFMIK